MKPNVLSIAVFALAVVSTSSAWGYDADWKRGRIYYRSVCTSCHAAEPIGSIAPSTRTRAEWTAYLAADKHAKDGTVSRFVSKGYRAEIKAANKAAEKFAEVPDAELAADLASFLDHGAKDGDAPASCN
jgi:cytochrome c